ncbi:hypothetical protein GCM10009830_05110 [Glycomyces endophyticus]|uniref:Uncharacterized protein n=1 Tax=Glycomyces endophyticus TaxID=480996 RepID=A0ABN2G024_9ACTN
MSSTTIRYSGVPENSHSRRLDFGADTASGLAADAASYSRQAPDDRYDRRPETDLTLKWRKRLRALADTDAASASGTHVASGSEGPARPGPGPFGSPGWYPDLRTGRHRRGEAPDPIPRPDHEEGRPGTSVPSPPQDPQPPRGFSSPLREQDRGDLSWSLDEECCGVPQSSEGQRGGSSRAPEEERGAASRPSEDQGGASSRSWREPGGADIRRESSGRLGRPSPSPSHRTTAEPRSAEAPVAPHRFDKLREDAWVRFLEKSAPLAAAHHTTRTGVRRDGNPSAGRLRRLILTVAGMIKYRGTARVATEPEWHVTSRADRSGSRITAPAAGESPNSAVLRLSTERPSIPRPRDLWGRTETALRTARFAQAVRGAARARSELAGGAAWA